MPNLIEGPSDDTLLPTTALAWSGPVLQSFVMYLPISAPVTINVGTFQRAAQSATLLYQARQCDKTALQGDIALSGSDVASLDKDIRCLLDAMLGQAHEWEVFCDSLAMTIRFVRYIGLVAYTPKTDIS